MRDLSGRRQRDVNNERRLKEYIAGQVVGNLDWILMNKIKLSTALGCTILLRNINK